MKLLEELRTEFGHIKIIQDDEGYLTYYQDGCFHSQATKEGVSTCAYIHLIYSVIRQKKARRILMIGCAGGTLATMLQRLGCEVTVVDINPHAFTLAKRYFQLPDTTECIVENGVAYVERTSQHYDAIVIDAFNSQSAIPKPFIQPSFFATVIKRMKPHGIVLMNVMVAHDLDMQADHIALLMEAAGLPVVLYDREGFIDRNIIVVAGAIDAITIPYGRDPSWISYESHSIVRRAPRRQGIVNHLL